MRLAIRQRGYDFYTSNRDDNAEKHCNDYIVWFSLSYKFFGSQALHYGIFLQIFFRIGDFRRHRDDLRGNDTILPLLMVSSVITWLKDTSG